MKLYKKTAARCKKDYAKLHGSVPIDQAFIQLFIESVQSFCKEDGLKSKLLESSGKLPKDWKPEWVRAADVLRFHYDWPARAIAIRGVDKDISQFAHNIAWEQRTKLSVNSEYANLRFRAVWQLLNSAAVHDWSFATQVANESRKLISGSTCYHIIAKAVFLLVDGNLKKAATIAKQKDKRSASYYLESQSIAFTRALCSTIVAAADNDPLRVAHGLKVALINVRDQAECALQAQGLAAILRRINPNLLSEFDSSSIELWDNELWNWSEAHTVSFASLNLKPLSHELHETLIDLEKPQWLEYKRPSDMSTKMKEVPVPEGITQSYWTDFCKKHAGYVKEIAKENDRQDHFIKYRKLNKQKQPANAFDWIPDRTNKFIRQDFEKSQASNLDSAAWFEKPGKSKSQFWAVNQFAELATIFVDPVGDKDLFEIRRFDTETDAKKFVKEAIQKQKAKGYVALRKGQPTPDQLAKAKAAQSGPKELTDPNQQAVAEFWQAFGVPKLQAQRIAKKAARDVEKDEDDSILKSMHEKAKRREEWSKTQKAKQKSINRETAALERELNRANKSKSANAKTTEQVPVKAASTKSSARSKSQPVSSQPRRFEFVAGNSSKFWTIRLTGASVITDWGRIGSAGQNTTKKLATAEKAQAEYEKLIKEKCNKGYKEV